MPIAYFICPDGKRTRIMNCLNRCRMRERCMFLPTLRAIAASSDRKLLKPSVTELIAGTREIYLKRTNEYAIDPFNTLFTVSFRIIPGSYNFLFMYCPPIWQVVPAVVLRFWHKDTLTPHRKSGGIFCHTSVLWLYIPMAIVYFLKPAAIYRLYTESIF